MTLTWKDGMAIGSGTPIGVTQTGVTQTVKTYGEFTKQFESQTGKPGDWFSTNGDVFPRLAKQRCHRSHRDRQTAREVSRGPDRAYDSSRNC